MNRKHLPFMVLIGIVSFSLINATEKKLIKKQQIKSLHSVNHESVESDLGHDVSNSREEIILWEEDFEGDHEWTFSSGWELTNTSYHSETTSALSANNDENMNGTFDMLTPVIDLPNIGDGETMNYGFWLYADLPDAAGDDGYLQDYYSVSVLDLAALAWHSSDFNASETNNFWCADEEIGGYLDSWIQYLDTPPISLGDNGQVTAQLRYTIESPAGAVVGGSCTDGWDSANIRISTDGGSSWELLEDSNNPYDFECGYGWIWNDTEYESGGSLNHLAAGWGGDSAGDGRWVSFNADLSSYANNDVIIRFAFGSDPAYCTMDDPGITGFQVDDIVVSDDSGELYSNTGDDESSVNISGEVWVDQFYDYGECADDRPGCDGWEEYVPGLAFNGNVFMDISDFAGRSVVFRIQSRFDADHDGGQGLGLHIDDFKIYKVSGGNYPPPIDLVATAGDSEAALSWYDMNASGTDDIVYHDDNFDGMNSIYMNGTSPAWAGERFDLFGPSTVNSITVNSINESPVDVTIGAFGRLGALFNSEPDYMMDVTLQPGDNTFEGLNWEMNNTFILAYTFYSVDTNGDGVIDYNTDYIVAAGLDTSPIGENSVILFTGGAWENWHDQAVQFSLPDGEWGVSANITYEGAGVTYNVYRDEVLVSTSQVVDNFYTDTGLTNNVTYEYAVTATYPDLEESDFSESVLVTPFANTVHEESYDDGTFEVEFSAGSGNYSAVHYSTTEAGTEQIVRFKWFQFGDGGAFYIKVFEDNGGVPGDELFSTVQAAGNSDGWNEVDLSDEDLFVSGSFWVGAKEFSSSQPFGLDTDSDLMVSYQREGDAGDWVHIAGNLAMHVFLDCGEMCGDMSAQDMQVPKAFQIYSVYPNPFNPTSTVSFELPESGNVVISIFDLSGKVVEELFSGFMSAGYNEISWDASDGIASGVYFVKLQFKDNVKTHKLMFLK